MRPRIAVHLTSAQLLTLVGGPALIVAGLASLLGDRLWIGLSYSIIPPDGVRQSAASAVASAVTVVAGGGLVVAGIFR